MSRLSCFTAAVLIHGLSVSAQIGGTITADAPTVTQSISFGSKTKLEVRYTAIHFGNGEWQGILEAC